jgi:hypothetical protein
MNIKFEIRNITIAGQSKLTITFGDDVTMDIDLTAIIARNPSLAPLKDAALFSKAKIGEHNRVVEWNDDIDLAGDNLRAEAIEQNGGISHERIWNWMHRNALTLDAAAEALGISRRMLVYYRNGEKPIPKHIWLACLGWERCRAEGEGRLKQAA